MKVAIFIALCAMLAVATAYYPDNYYGWYGQPYGAHPYGAHPYVNGAVGYYGLPNYYGYGYGHPFNSFLYNKAAAADKVDVAAAAAAEASVPAAK